MFLELVTICEIFAVQNAALDFRPVFLNRRAAARYRALASIIPGRERFSWNLSFYFSKQFSRINVL